MSTYILMKILESTPSRYDRGISILTRGKLDGAYNCLISHINHGEKVLDIGCGTGLLTLKAAFKGAIVKGIDVNSQMLEIAQKRVEEANLSHIIELSEMGVAELDREKSNYYDDVLSGLCFSELTEDEQIYALKQVKRILKPGGHLLIADEVRPKGIFKSLLNMLIRFPLVIITYLITQTSTHAVKDLPDKIRLTGLKLESIQLNNFEDFMILMALKTKERDK